MVKEKDGAFGKEKVYYVNSVTGMKSHEVPPPLPKGWKEALHKDSGRVYYYNKETRETTFEFPGNGAAGEDQDDDDDDGDIPDAPEGFIGRTISKFTGKKKKDDGLERSATLSKRTETMKRGKAAEKAAAPAAAPAAAAPAVPAAAPAAAPAPAEEEADDNQRLNTLCTLAVDPLRGCVYICEQSNNRIRSIELSDLSR